MRQINKQQTPHERRTKYNFLRYSGVSSQMAERMRDWTLSHILQLLNSADKKKLRRHRREYIKNKEA